MIGRAGPGGEVLLLADQGDYNVTGILGITRGGAEGQPVVVRGIDSAGNTMGAHFTGSRPADRSEEHTSELQSLMRISYAVFCLQKKNRPHKKICTITKLNKL